MFDSSNEVFRRKSVIPNSGGGDFRKSVVTTLTDLFVLNVVL
jgi:hypothetical protein